MPNKTDREIGPNASTHRGLLNDEEVELFDWLTAKLVGNDKDALYFGSMLQAIACFMPRATYWQVVAAARKISSEPGAEERRAAAEAQAWVDLAKPTEA